MFGDLPQDKGQPVRSKNTSGLVVLFFPSRRALFSLPLANLIEHVKQKTEDNSTSINKPSTTNSLHRLQTASENLPNF